MKSANKKLFINLAIAVVLTIVVLFNFGPGSARDVALAFGIVCLGLGLLNFFIGLVFLIVNRKTVRDGWLLSGAILLLLSGVSCGGGMRF
jgi:hypothetical protein